MLDELGGGGESSKKKGKTSGGLSKGKEKEEREDGRAAKITGAKLAVSRLRYAMEYAVELEVVDKFHMDVLMRRLVEVEKIVEAM